MGGMKKRKRPPAPSCARCGETLGAIGGKRVVGTPERGVLLCGPEITLGELHHPTQTELLEGKEKLVVVTYGAGWTDDARARAKEAAVEGQRPWICQKCAGRTCAVCGAPLEVPIASTLLNDDGAVTHLMIVPTRISCINADCASAAVVIK
jgi:hypothetical protein